MNILLSFLQTGAGAAAGIGALAGIPGLGWAILGAVAVAKIGTGIYNVAKGRKMQKQAISDREMYINTMSSWVEWGQQQQKQAARSALNVWGSTDIPKIGDLSASSMQRGQITEQEQLGRYFNTLGQTTGRISEKDLMQKKFGLGG